MANMENKNIIAGMSGAGYTRIISVPGDNGRYHKAVVIYRDRTIPEFKKELEAKLYKLSKRATQSSPFPGLYVIPDIYIGELKSLMDNAEKEWEATTQEILVAYDDIKKANKEDVIKDIEKLSANEQAEILKLFDARYPSKEEIKRKRRLRFSIMTSPLANGLNLDALKERIEDTAQELYKKAVVESLIPAYEAFATYYARANNGMEVGQKSINHFYNSILPELIESNEIRKDGFTEQLLEAIKTHQDEVFEDPMLAYNLLLAIWDEAHKLDMEECLPDLEALERKKLSAATAPQYLLTPENLKEDAENRTPLNILMGGLVLTEVSA